MAARVAAYLAERRQAGYALRIEGYQLARFARFADAAGHRGPPTLELAIGWASASHAQRPLTAARRIEVLRGFAHYCRREEPATEIPSRFLFGRPHRRLAPHIYTDRELSQLIAAATRLHPAGGLRGTSCATIFGLIAASGLRISEATGLARTDVDLERGRLLVRQAKFGKSRWVPLHATTTLALRDYAARRDRDRFASGHAAFFLFDYGRPARTRAVQYAFTLLRRQLGWRARGGHAMPRIHDLRHTFICRRFEQWYREGLDVDRHVLALSTYVGHAKVTDTYWYATATPELLALAARRVEHARGGARP